MKKIEENYNSVIEHLKDKDHHKEIELDFNNLLISCRGGQDDRAVVENKRERKKIPIYCDASKGNKEIFITPSKASISFIGRLSPQIIMFFLA